MLKIAIIGTGNVGGALATAFAKAGHTILLGVRDKDNFKGKGLLENPNTEVFSIAEAVKKSEVIVMGVPADSTVTTTKALGNTTGKVIIDTMNLVRKGSLEHFTNTAEAILAFTQTRDVVKCFNITGFNNMKNPMYDGTAIDAFVGR